jgi:transcriptional regulator with XRE-family HTH domain
VNVISKTAVTRETERRLRTQAIRTGDDIRRLRLDAGVSLREVGAVTGIHASHLARIEAAQVQPSIEVLTRVGIALGADLSIRYFAGIGPRLHDRFQAPMVEGLLHILDARWVANPEVPVVQPARGVIDLVLDDQSSPTTVASESQSEFRRLEEQLRWSAEKADGLAARLAREGRAERVVSRLLLLRSTEATREVARRFEATLAAAYPARAADVYRALTSPWAPWPGAGILWIRLDNGETTVLGTPPRGVSVGR